MFQVRIYLGRDQWINAMRNMTRDRAETVATQYRAGGTFAIVVRQIGYL